jgi:hypothetical protein
MTQEEQDAILGRTLREYNDCCRQIGAMQAELSRLGKELERLGQKLIRNPEGALFAGQPHNARFGRGQAYPGGPQSEAAFQPEAINGADIAKRVTELQESVMQKADLARRLESLGHKV